LEKTFVIEQLAILKLNLGIPRNFNGKKKNILGIDAMNIRDGGGLTHLREILLHATFDTIYFDKVIVWGNESCLQQLPDQPWLTKINPIPGKTSGLHTTYWQIFCLGKAARELKCSLLFIAGGSTLTHFRPYVTICHNMLPFTETALQQYTNGLRKYKFLLLRKVQLHTFKKAKGIIFLSYWAMEQLQPLIAKPQLKFAVIPHGINPGFKITNRLHRNIADCNKTQPFTILYVSRIEPYKNQLTVIDLVAAIRNVTGWPIRLVLAGLASDAKYNASMQQKIQSVDATSDWITYQGPVPYDNLRDLNAQADMAVFASTCENMPIILLEKMASGLPIVCSNTAPMPDFLKDAGLYAAIEDVAAFQLTVQQLIENKELRVSLSGKAQEYAANYQWSKAAADTFQFLYSCQ
jgi:glycosyltransferase involved in cell wall biosynthesis